MRELFDISTNLHLISLKSLPGMQVVFVSPFLTDFDVRSYQIGAYDRDDIEAWNAFENAISSFETKVSYLNDIHVGAGVDDVVGMRYEDKSRDGVFSSQSIIQLSLADRSFDDVELTSTQIYIYNNKIGIIRTVRSIYSCPRPENINAYSTPMDGIITSFIKEIYNDLLIPLFIHIASLQSKSGLVSLSEGLRNRIGTTLPHYRPGAQHSKAHRKETSKSLMRPPDPLWINRTLVVQREDYFDLIDHFKVWTTRDGSWPVYTEPTLPDYDVYPGHIITTLVPGSKKYRDFFKVLRLVHFYNALFDLLNIDLSRYINRSGNDPARVDIMRLRKKVEEISNNASTAIFSYEDSIMDLQGWRRETAIDICATYGIKGLVQRIQRKIDVTDRLSRQLMEEASATYYQIVEFILFALGGLSLVDLSIAVSEYGRSAAMGDTSGATVSEDGIPGLLDVGRVLPPDILIYINIMFLFTLSALFIYLKRTKRT